MLPFSPVNVIRIWLLGIILPHEVFTRIGIENETVIVADLS